MGTSSGDGILVMGWGWGEKVILMQLSSWLVYLCRRCLSGQFYNTRYDTPD